MIYPLKLMKNGQVGVLLQCVEDILECLAGDGR
jgi:hypothetical protein